MTIHKEGTATLLITIIGLSIINVLVQFYSLFPQWFVGLVGVLSVVFFLIILQFFRKPKRKTIQKSLYTVVTVLNTLYNLFNL